jgi:hypothetical protein
VTINQKLVARKIKIASVASLAREGVDGVVEAFTGERSLVAKTGVVAVLLSSVTHWG